MKNLYKKIIIMFVMVLGIMGAYSINAFADDSFEIGTSNLNSTVENSAKVGDILLKPEIDWKRYDDTAENIFFTGGKKVHNFKEYYNSTYSTSKIEPVSKENAIIMRIFSSKIRLIGGKNTQYRSNNVVIEIDGKIKRFNQGDKDGNQIIEFEEKSMEKIVHTIKIYVDNDTTQAPLYNKPVVDLDAIDIDSDGKLLDWQEKSISIDKSTLNLKEVTSSKLTATTTPAGAIVTWSSSDESVATVDSNGNVKAIKEGQSTITAQIKDTDIKATCVVTVTKEENPVEPDEPTDPDQEYIINTAYAKGENTNNASGQVTIIFKGNAEAQLKVVKTADVDSVYVGDNFTYTIEVTNTSDKVAKSVIIKDSAPNHIQFIPSEVTTTQGTVDSSSTGNNIIVNVGDIPSLGKVTIKIPVVVVE